MRIARVRELKINASDLDILKKNGRSGGIRTPDILLPKQARYQAALHSADTYQALVKIRLSGLFKNCKPVAEFNRIFF